MATITAETPTTDASTDTWDDRFLARREAEAGKDIPIPGARFNSSPA